MRLESFRELLLKKCVDPDLENIIHFVKEEVLANIIMESLEKMARASHKGDAANLAIRHFGTEMDPELEPNMLHDALSHHASHYKSALKSGNKDLANEHGKQIFRLMDMADQAQKHSQGKLHVEAVSPHAWERNSKQRKFTAEDEPVKRGSKKPGQFVTDTKGWRYRGNDYGFLQQAPHEHYKNEIRRHQNNNAYPLENVQVNGKYLDINDVPAEEQKGYAEHPFDKHPVMSHFETPVSKRTPEDDAAYMNGLEQYHSSPHMDRYFDRHDQMKQKNPDAYEARGKNKSEAVHPQVDPLDISGESEAKPAAEAAPATMKRPAAKEGMSLQQKQEMLNSETGKRIPEVIRNQWLKEIKDAGGSNE